MKGNFIFTPQQIGNRQQWSLGIIGNLTEQQDFQRYMTQMAYPGTKEGVWKEPITLDIKISPAALKSEKMRMYAFYAGPLMSVAVPAFVNAGYEFVDEVLVDCELKRMFAKRITIKHDEEIGYHTEDKSKMTKERLHKYLCDCVHFLDSVMGVDIPDSGAYKVNRGRDTNFKSVRS